MTTEVNWTKVELFSKALTLDSEQELTWGEGTQDKAIVYEICAAASNITPGEPWPALPSLCHVVCL